MQLVKRLNLFLHMKMLQLSQFVFICDRLLRQPAAIVEWRDVLMSFSWLKLLLLSQDVKGRVSAS